MKVINRNSQLKLKLKNKPGFKSGFKSGLKSGLDSGLKSSLNSKLKRQLGFTLIEVMAAVAIFAVSTVGLFSINQQTVLVADRLESKTFSNWLAMNAMVELELDEKLPSPGEESEDKEMAGKEWKVVTEISETALQTVRRVTITVLDDVNGDSIEHARLIGFVGASSTAQTGSFP